LRLSASKRNHLVLTGVAENSVYHMLIEIKGTKFIINDEEFGSVREYIEEYPYALLFPCNK